MMWGQRYVASLLCLLYLFLAIPAYSSELSPGMKRLCERISEERFSPSVPPKRLPEDPLLAVIASSDDAQKIRASLVPSEVNAPRGRHGTTALMFAVSVNNWAAARTLIALGADVNQSANYGETPLERAIGLFHGPLACQLIANGAVLAPSASNAFLLPAAAAIKRTEDAGVLVTFLLDRGWDVNSLLPPANETALHLAAGTGNIQLVRVLIERGADPAMKTRQAQTALDIAKQAKQQGVVQVLVSTNKARR